MEEYLKKQKELKQGGGVKTTAAPVRKAKDISESSDKYTDEDFDSVSKSQSHSLPSAPALRQQSHI